MDLDISIGNSSFRKLRESGSYYVDKSFLISELVATQSEILLLPRPRRFGKTLNLSMLHCFFDRNQQSADLFEGLAVTRDPVAMAQLNAYPSVFLTFNGMDYLTWESCRVGIMGRIAKLLGTHIDLLKQAADPAQLELLENLHFRRGPFELCAESLLLITELLFKATGKRVVILIDEYDKLIHEGQIHGYYPEIVAFMRNFMGAGLKDNPYLERAVITGILRIAKESIYSGLNNLAVYSILDPPFSTCFGFTEAEVHQLLSDAGLTDQLEAVKFWYNGYTFGKGQVIYNPWSILCFVSRASEGLKAYWLGTSGNDLVYEIINQGRGMDLDELEQLLEGRSVRKNLNIHVGMREKTAETIWHILLFAGYLTAENYDPVEESADLSIPNFEVQLFYRDTVSLWFGQASSPDTLVSCLLQERLADFARGLAEAVKSILSFHDTGGTTPERIYHIFVVGLMVHLRERYRIESNRESGGGRADLMLLPRKPGATGFLFEFKAAAKGDLKKLAQAALTQVADQDYATSFREAGTRKLLVLGLAVRGKRIALASYSEDLTNGTRSQIQEFSEGREAKTDKSPKAKPKSEERAVSVMDPQKLLMIGQIQLLQEQKGQTILPLETMISADIKFLAAMLETLKGR